MNRTCLAATPRVSFWIAIFALLTVSAFGAHRPHSQSANKLYKEAQKAEAAGNDDAAFNLYQQAAQKAPDDMRIRTSLYRVRVSAASIHISQGRKLLNSGDLQGALQEFLHASEIDPANEAALQEIAVVRRRMGQAEQGIPTPETSRERQLQSMGSPVQLKPVSNEPLTLHMTEDSKVVYQAIGRAAGINVLFDPDYVSKRIQVDLTNSTLMDALRIVGVISGTFWRPITSNTIFVAQDTRNKRNLLEESAIQTFYLANAWQQNDLNDVQTALRNVLADIKVYGLASQNALVVRGTPDELLMAQKLIDDLDKARPEVVVDIAVMEVSKNWERTLGIQWPGSVSVQLQSPTANTSTGTTGCLPTDPTCVNTGTTNTGPSPTLYNLAHLNSNDFAVTLGAATANLLLTDSNTHILLNPRLRATDMQKATMKIGERIPIATGSYQTGAATALVSSLVNTQFQYIDVGVNIEITPTVHFDNDVTLKMKLDVTAQAGNVTISGVTEPIIAQKTTEETVRLREGEANILSGILNQQDQQSWSGIPGLSSIPILKYLFGSMDHTITDDEVVFLMVPHVVRGADITTENLRPIDTGPGNMGVQLRRIATNGPGANVPAQVQPVTTQSIAPHPPVSEPSVAAVPGQSATSAAPNALQQFKQSAAGVTSPVPQTNLNPKPLQPVPAGAPATPPPGGTPTPPGVELHYLLNSPPPVANGSTFQVPIVASGAADLASSALRIKYDPAHLALVNVGGGDLLSRDGQSVAESHSDDGPGNITLNISRPPGAAGVNGAGVVAVLSFQAKAPGQSSISVMRAGGLNSKQQPVAAQGSQIDVQVK
jgi:general secretion pathway protein D